MRKTSFIVAAIVAGCALPASAEHLTHVDPSTGELKEPVAESRTIDIDIKLGGNAFRIGGRILGDKGVSGAWLNGQLRPDGFALDGRVQGGEGRAYNFKVNADVLDFLVRVPWWFPRRAIAD
jgi:hypothetical protein